jgi:hypothetical protein
MSQQKTTDSEKHQRLIDANRKIDESLIRASSAGEPRKQRQAGLSESAKLNRAKNRELTDGSKGHRKSPDDEIDAMIRKSIDSQGA